MLDKLKNNWVLIYLSIQLINIFFIISFLRLNLYLPAPFVLDKSNTFMDFYNPLIWLNNLEIYSAAKSVYPPLNFLILKPILQIFDVLGVDSTSAETLRAGSNLFQVVLVAFYMAIIFYSAASNLLKYSINKQNIILAASITLSIPVFFAIERGNLIIIALLVFTLYVADRDKEGNKSLILLAILINLKPYFLLFSLLYVRKINILIKLVIITVSIFVISGMLVEKDFYLFFRNILFFNGIGGGIPPLDQLALPSSIKAISAIFTVIPNLRHYIFWYSLLKTLLIISIILILYAIIFKKNINWNEKLVAITLVITNYSAMSGGYSVILYLPLLHYFMSNKVLLTLVLLIFMPIDVIPIYRELYNEVPLYSYIGNTFFEGVKDLYVIPNMEIYLGSILRALMNFLLILYFSMSIAKRKNES